MAKTAQKIGIMGGTFDPIHIGHLVAAEAVRLEYALDKVIFIPAGNPPHKQTSKVTPAMHRFVMTVMATYSNPNFLVSAIEIERRGPSYTIDTVTALKEQYGQETQIYFITGVDAAQDLKTWHHIDKLLDMCDFVAAARPGCSSTLDSMINDFGLKGQQRIHRLATPELEISSTDIRERIRQGKSIKYIVPESVENYILKEGLYR